jgi:hypothetical protein
MNGRAHGHPACDVDVEMYNARCHDAGTVTSSSGCTPGCPCWRGMDSSADMSTSRAEHTAPRRVRYCTMRAARLSCIIADAPIRRGEHRHAGSSCTLLDGKVRKASLGMTVSSGFRCLTELVMSSRVFRTAHFKSEKGYHLTVVNTSLSHREAGNHRGELLPRSAGTTRKISPYLPSDRNRPRAPQSL